jgi:acylphosphatase
MSEQSCARVLISGRVQGVGFRYFITSRAEQFDIVGYVRNLDTGAVEIEIEGDRAVIVEFLTEIKLGPRLAEIHEFQTEWKPYKMRYDRFFVKY